MLMIKVLMTAGMAFLLLSPTVACKKDAGNGSNGAKGRATGKVTDTRGNPLAGAEVTIENTMVYNSSAAGVSGNDGRYSIQLPEAGTFHASAYIKRSYNGKTYTLDMTPDNNEPFGIEGAVRNFTWKMSGKKPQDNDGYYGATIGINNAPGHVIVDDYNIEFTLTPQGKLIDGSDGQVLKLHSGQPNTPTYGYLADIPLGRYTMTAVYVSGGASTPLKLKKNFSQDNYTGSLQIDFEPEGTWGKNAAFIEYMP